MIWLGESGHILMKYLKLFVVVLILSGFLIACGGRLPTPKTARSASISYFKKYGKKYPNTKFGAKNLDNITINSIEEISYKFALADVIVTFVDGTAARTLVRMHRKFPTGWSVASWEMVGYQ